MSVLSFIPIIGKAIDKGLGVIDKLVKDKDLAEQLKAEIKSQALTQNHDQLVQELQSQTQIILAEAKGGWLQRNWRPLLMLVIILIIFNNYVAAPYIGLFLPNKELILELPGGLWALLNVGVGGYVGGRSAEKIFKRD